MLPADARDGVLVAAPARYGGNADTPITPVVNAHSLQRLLVRQTGSHELQFQVVPARCELIQASAATQQQRYRLVHRQPL